MTQEPRPIVNIADSIFVFLACCGFTCWVIAVLGLVDYMGMTGPLGDIVLWFGSMLHVIIYLAGCGILYMAIRVMCFVIEAPAPAQPPTQSEQSNVQYFKPGEFIPADRVAKDKSDKIYNIEEDITGKATPAQDEWVQQPKVKKVQVRPPVMAGTCTPTKVKTVDKVRCRFCRTLNPVGESTCQNPKCGAMLYDTPHDRVRVNE